MRYGRDYDRGYGPDLGRGPETNWMGRNYRTPGGGRPRGYDAHFGAGYAPRRGAWNVEPPGPAYDRPYRGGGYDRPYRGYDRGYDPAYRETGGTMRGGGRILSDPWGPYSAFRQAQRRLSYEERPWPHQYFTDHGHDTGHR